MPTPKKKKPAPAASSTAAPEAKPRRAAKPSAPKATAPAADPRSLADALCEAHVAWWEHRLTDTAALEAWMRAELARILADAATLKLKDVVSGAQVKAVARRYAVELDLKGGIPELVADVATALYESPAHDRARVIDVLPEAHFLDMLDKALEMEDLRGKLVRGAVTTPFYIAFASDLLYRGIRDYVNQQTEMAQRIPGAGSMMKLGKSVLNRARPDLEQSVEQGLRKYIERTVEATAVNSAELLLAKLDRDTLRGMALEIWQSIKQAPVSRFKDEISALDVEEMFCLGYAYWGDVRQSSYLVALLNAGIERFYARYGGETLTALLDDLGITFEMMIEEGLRFAPPVIATLRKKKLLAPLIRRQLADFYASPEVARLLAERS